jgi:hypothetical protein
MLGQSYFLLTLQQHTKGLTLSTCCRIYENVARERHGPIIMVNRATSNAILKSKFEIMKGLRCWSNESIVPTKDGPYTFVHVKNCIRANRASTRSADRRVPYTGLVVPQRPFHCSMMGGEVQDMALEV